MLDDLSVYDGVRLGTSMVTRFLSKVSPGKARQVQNFLNRDEEFNPICDNFYPNFD